MLTSWWGLWCADATRGLAGRWKGALGGVRQVGRQEGQTRDELQAGVQEPWFLGMEAVGVGVWD